MLNHIFKKKLALNGWPEGLLGMMYNYIWGDSPGTISPPFLVPQNELSTFEYMMLFGHDFPLWTEKNDKEGQISISFKRQKNLTK